MKRMTRSQFNLMADALKTAVREALSEEVNAIFAARIAALGDMAEETNEPEDAEAPGEPGENGKPGNSGMSGASGEPGMSGASGTSGNTGEPLAPADSPLQACIAQAGLSEEDAALLEPVASDVSAMIEHGRWADLLPLLTRAARYDKDVARAAEEGELRGRNAAVDIALKRLNRSDGIPVTPSANIPAADFKPVSIFSLARQAKES
ncbi:collagen-like triple helix repeat-containing protein [Pseudoprevotella muciniphila]|nr:collagen-like protein [Pseudoprevotella muciniphila]